MLKKLLTLLLLLLTTTAQTAAQQDVAFTARLSKNQTLTNSTVEYTVALTNAQGSDLTAPSFRDFKVLNGPNRAVSTSIINGVASSRQAFTWLLQPRREGRLSVEPATIRANGRTYRTNSQYLTVLPASAGTDGLGPDQLLRAEISTAEAYVGQQILLNLNLYSTTNVVSRNVMKEPTFDGFFNQARRQYDGRPRSAIENGKEYEVRTLGSVALFPSKSGRLTITPYDMVVGVVRYRTANGRQRRFMEQVALSSDTVYINVSELPRPQPANFTGGVGSYRLDATINRDQMTTDDAITMRLTIVGEGDIKRLGAFDPVNRRDWEIYDPKVLQEELLDSPSGIIGRKIFEYDLVPKRGGDFTLTPELVYFNVDSNDYVSLAPESFNVTVAGGTGTPTYDLDSLTTQEAELTLLPAPEELPTGRDYRRDPSDSGVFWLLFLLPLIGSAGAIGYARYQDQQANRDPAEVARARAAKAATNRLKTAETFQQKRDARGFYNAVESALLGYLRDKLGLPVAELSRRNIAEKLATAGADTALTERYDAMLARCEMALYAGQDSADDLAQTYTTAKELIIDTDRSLT